MCEWQCGVETGVERAESDRGERDLVRVYHAVNVCVCA
jgi:hypothetical protein